MTAPSNPLEREHIPTLKLVLRPGDIFVMSDPANASAPLRLMRVAKTTRKVAVFEELDANHQPTGEWLRWIRKKQ